MGFGPYLAMTKAEYDAAARIPAKPAWLDCQFSPEDTGLANLPPALIPVSLLVLTDQVPISGHDPARVALQLKQAAEKPGCDGVLLDFQRPVTGEALAMAEQLVSSLSCPVAVSEDYAKNLNCPVFLPPCLHHTHLKAHIAPCAGRDIWLDLALNAEILTLTKRGCTISLLPPGDVPEGGFKDKALHCHYRTETGADFARFTLWRTQKDLEDLAQEAEDLGIQTFIGLWNEWRKKNNGY